MPVVNTTNSFSNNEQITSGKLNNIMDNSFFVTDAVVPSGGLQVTAGGQMQIGDNANGVTTAKIADLNVTTDKIADGAVTPAKLSAAGPYWDSAGGTFLFSQRVLEVGSGITSNTDSIIDFHAVHPLTDYEARIIRSSGDNGTFSIVNNGTGAIELSAGAITLSASGGVTFGTANMPTPSGSAPIYGIRAWVNFDASRDASGATNASNTNRFIRSSGNVTSVLKTGTGKFTVTFTAAMPNTNYVVTSSAGLAGSPRSACADRTTATTTSIEIETDDAAGAAANFTENNVMVIS